MQRHDNISILRISKKDKKRSILLLFFAEVDHFFLENSRLLKLVNCAMSYTLQTHDALEKVIQFVPENVVVNGDDVIPGIVEDASEGLNYNSV